MQNQHTRWWMQTWFKTNWTNASIEL